MSDDLKGRLRKLEGGDKYGSTVWYRNPDGPEAASRIEKLEAALRRIKHMHEDGGVDDIVERDDRTYFIVCKALEGKDDR